MNNAAVNMGQDPENCQCLPFTFRSSVHLELMFVFDMRWTTELVFFSLLYPIDPVPFIEKIVLRCIAKSFLSYTTCLYICVGLFLGL